MRKTDKDNQSNAIQPLPSIEFGYTPNLLLLGNGLCRSFDTESWEDIIKGSIEKYKCAYKYEDFKNMPANMQIVVATHNHVNHEMGYIQNKLIKPIGADQREYIRDVINIGITDILTTNYDYNIEQALGCEFGLGHFQKCRRWTKAVSEPEKRTNLFQYSLISAEEGFKRIWHIHGDVCYRESMIMGHYYYGKQLFAIQDKLPERMATIKASITKQIPWQPIRWTDLFLMGNVHIVGLGFYFTETDLWWLLECKNRHFPDTKVYYYQPKEKIDKDIKMMLELFDNVEIIDKHPLTGKDYKSYYQSVLADIGSSI